MRSASARGAVLDEGVQLVATSLVDCYHRLVAEAPRAKAGPSLLLSMSLDKWSQAYTEEPNSAVVEVLNLFLVVAGLPNSRLDLSSVDAARRPPPARCHRASCRRICPAPGAPPPAP